VSDACCKEHPPQLLKCLQAGFILSETGLIIFGELTLPFSTFPSICSPGRVKGANISPFGVSIIHHLIGPVDQQYIQTFILHH